MLSFKQLAISNPSCSVLLLQAHFTSHHPFCTKNSPRLPRHSSNLLPALQPPVPYPCPGTGLPTPALLAPEWQLFQSFCPPHVSLVTRRTSPNLTDPSLPSILPCHFSLSFINLASDNSLCIHCCTSPGNRNGLWLTSHHRCVSVFVHVDQKLPGLEKVI